MCNLKVNIYVLETYFTFILFLWSIHAFNLFRNLLYIVVALWRGIPCTFLTKVHTESRLQNKAGIYRYMYCKHYQQTNIIEKRNLLNDTKKRLQIPGIFCKYVWKQGLFLNARCESMQSMGYSQPLTIFHVWYRRRLCVHV